MLLNVLDTDPIEVYKFYKRVKVVIGCVDNNPTRVILDKVFNKIDIRIPYVYIDSGNGTDNRCGQIVVGVKSCESYLPPVGVLHREEVYNNETMEEVLSCGQASLENPQNIGTNIYAAVNIFQIINNLLYSGEIYANELEFNCEFLSTKVIKKAIRM